VGCGCALLLVLGACGGAGLLVKMGWNTAGSKFSAIAGVDSMLQTAKDVSGAGFSFGVNTSPDGTEYTLKPMSPREVSCEELKDILQPHLVGDLSSVVILSESTITDVEGRQQVIPVRCSWEGGAAAEPSQWDLPQTAKPSDGP